MKRENIDWAELQGAIIVFFISLIAACSLTGITWYYQDKMIAKYNSDKKNFQSISSRYLAVDEEERLIKEYYPEFIELYKRGILGREHRLNWIETLRDSGERIKLPGLRYVINSQNKFNPDYAVNLGNFQIYTSPMTLNIQLLHEGDIINLLNDLNNHALGLYNIPRCKFVRIGRVINQNPKQGNISVECNLRWFNIKKADGSEINLL